MNYELIEINLFDKLTGFSIAVLSITGFVIISSLITGDLRKEVLYCENDSCDLSNWFTLFVGAVIAISVALYVWKKQESLKILQTESSLIFVIQHLLELQHQLQLFNTSLSNIDSTQWIQIRDNKFKINSTFNQNQISISQNMEKIFQEDDSIKKIIERSYYVIEPKIILQLENVSERISNISELNYNQLSENASNFDSYIDEIKNDRLQQYYQKLPKRIKDKFS